MNKECVELTDFCVAVRAWCAQVRNQFALAHVYRKRRASHLLCVHPRPMFAVPWRFAYNHIHSLARSRVQPWHQCLACWNSSLVSPVAHRHYWAWLLFSDL